MSKKQKDRQITAFDTTMGRTGYLREAYHGEPYATEKLIPEARNKTLDPSNLQVPNRLLKQRLPSTIKAAIKREQTIYKAKNVTIKSPVVKSYIDFVALHEKLEKAGKKPRIFYSG